RPGSTPSKTCSQGSTNDRFAFHSQVPPLDFDSLHPHRHRQLRLYRLCRAGGGTTTGNLCTATAAGPADVLGPLHVLPALPVGPPWEAEPCLKEDPKARR